MTQSFPLPNEERLLICLFSQSKGFIRANVVTFIVLCVTVSRVYILLYSREMKVGGVGEV